MPRSSSSAPASTAPHRTRAETALHVVNHISAMVAYWDAQERCVFANAAYQEWFGRDSDLLTGKTLKELLGPIYEKNAPYIRGALAGEPQIFERQIPIPGGGVRDSIATYTPEIVNGKVTGFSVHVADVTGLRQREASLAAAIRATVAALEKTKTSFRSKELGVLRQNLVKVLERLEGP